MPHAYYLNPNCPWLGCSFAVTHLDFRLELGASTLYQQGLLAWGQALSLIGRCPSCGRDIAFSTDGMLTGDSAPSGSVRLGDDWYLTAILLDANGDPLTFVP